MNDITSFGEWLRRRRKAFDLTQAELADRAGCVTGTIKSIEADARRPSKQLAERLAQVLQLGPDERATFLKAARAELSPDRLASPTQAAVRAVGSAATPLPAEAEQRTLPSGTVTFLFTDIEGSTTLAQAYPDSLSSLLAQHHTILDQSIAAHHGYVFQIVGDAFSAAFHTASDALQAALAAQRRLHHETWHPTRIKVRMGIHTGAAQAGAIDAVAGGYVGYLTLTRTQRIMSAGHGGQTLLSAATQELVRDQLPPDVTLRDLGEQRLKDLSRPEHIFQLVAPDLPADFPSLKTLDARRTNLPAQPTPLIGREAEVRSVQDLLRQPTIRMLTLTGPGGIGKTRLALQVAAELLDDTRDGVFFVALAPIRDAHLVAPAIARELEIADAGEISLLDRLKRYLHTRQVLLLLDNFEQVIGAASLLAELLAVAPGLKMLVTSREALRISGEHEYAVPPLALPDLNRLPPLERLSQYEAVQLFIDRAQMVKPDFAVTNASAPAVAEICARLDGLPLAIELAAARSRIFTPQALLTRLAGAKQRLSLLTGGARDVPARQQTLRDAIAWSYDLLDADEQALFARLAVFVGGFTLEAAEAVCGDRPLAEIVQTWTSNDNDYFEHEDLPELIAWARQEPPLLLALPTEQMAGLLESLVGKSLVRPTEESESPRFMMLETIREYALERLAESGEEQAIRWRHAGYYTWWHETINPWGHPRGIAALEDELDNFRALLDWCVGSGEVLPGLIIGADFTLWGERVNEGRQRLAALLSRSVPLSHATAYAWYSAAFLAISNYDYPAARAALETSYQMRAEFGEPTHLKYFGLGFIALGEGDVAEAGHLFERLLVHADEPANHSRDAEVAWAHVGLGAYHLVAGSLAEAQTHLEASLKFFRATGQIEPVSSTLNRLGFIAQLQGDLRRSASSFRESIELARTRYYRRNIGSSLFGLAGVAHGQGKLEQAARLLGAAEALRTITGGRDPDEGYVTNRVAATLRAQLDPELLATGWAEGQALSLEQAIEEALEASRDMLRDG